MRDVMEGLTNDGKFQCTECTEIFAVFSEGGSTDFCPRCGSRDFESTE